MYIKKAIFLVMAALGMSVGYTQGESSLLKLLLKYNTGEIPYKKVSEITHEEAYIYIDAREKAEYNVSHLKNAVFVGYEDFTLANMPQSISKSSKILVYCSLGVRSEKIGIQLKEAGYTQVYNLYGGIFEWKKAGKKIYQNDGKETDYVHGYNKFWSKFANGLKVKL